MHACAHAHSLSRPLSVGCVHLVRVRLNFPYFLDDHARDYIIRAVNMVADHGWKLLPEYVFDVKTSLWQHRDVKRSPPRVTKLVDLAFDLSSSGGVAGVTHPTREEYGELTRETYERLLEEARAAMEAANTRDYSDDPPQKIILDHDVQPLQYFALPTDFMGSPPKPITGIVTIADSLRNESSQAGDGDNLSDDDEDDDDGDGEDGGEDGGAMKSTEVSEGDSSGVADEEARQSKRSSKKNKKKAMTKKKHSAKGKKQHSRSG